VLRIVVFASTDRALEGSRGELTLIHVMRDSPAMATLFQGGRASRNYELAGFGKHEDRGLVDGSQGSGSRVIVGKKNRGAFTVFGNTQGLPFW